MGAYFFNGDRERFVTEFLRSCIGKPHLLWTKANLPRFCSKRSLDMTHNTQAALLFKLRYGAIFSLYIGNRLSRHRSSSTENSSKPEPSIAAARPWRSTYFAFRPISF